MTSHEHEPECAPVRVETPEGGDTVTQALGTLREALEACAALLEDYADVIDGDDGYPRPNRAMSLLRDVAAALAATAPEQAKP